MSVDITCKTDRFNLSVVGNDFINECCFGEDFSRWLVAALGAAGVEADMICMEDFGWANSATVDGATYLVCVAGLSDEIAERPDFGEWRVMLDRRRSFRQKLLGQGKTSVNDPLVGRVVDVLKAAGFSDVAVES